MGDILQGVAGFLDARERASAMETRAAFAKDEAATARAAAAQDEAMRRRNLLATIAAQDAVRAGRGMTSMTTGTALSIYGDTKGEAERDIETSRLEYLMRADRLRAQARSEQSAARTTRIGGFLSLGAGIVRQGENSGLLKMSAPGGQP